MIKHLFSLCILSLAVVVSSNSIDEFDILDASIDEHTIDTIDNKIQSYGSFDAAKCSYTHTLDGKQYVWNLQGLSTQTFYDKKDPDNFYSIRFCKESEDSNCANNKGKHGSVCAYDNNKFVANLGSFVDTPDITFELVVPNDVDSGIKLSFKNGDVEGGQSVVFKLDLLCRLDENPYILTISQIMTMYFGDFKSPYGCHGYGGSSGGLSGGWIFIIILLCSLTVYFIAGFIINMKVYGKSGSDAIPQVGFWTSIPGYTAAGCKVTYAKLRSLCGKSSNQSSADY